jgi:predicted AlkP superfamily phosphohydrolase/phosphomutase
MGGPVDSERKSRVLVIGLDAADRELIEQWCGDGLLPNLSRIRAQGTWAALHTTADTVHVSAWPGIFSGTTPDKHGLYHAYVMRPGEQAPVRPRPEECPVPFLWKLLDENGVRSIVMDAFLTCPLRDFSGVQIVDWGSWTWFSGQDIRPESIKQEIRRRFGAYPAENHSKVGMTPPSDPAGFRRRLLKGVEKKSEVAQWLMDSQDWEFFLLVFGECHAAGHYFWHYMDPDYVAYPEQAAAELRSALRDVYVALDGAIGDLLARCDERTTVYVVSGDGMGPNYSGSHLLNALLERMQLSNVQGDGPSVAPVKPRKGLASTLRAIVPKNVRALVSKHVLPRSFNEKLSMHWKTADIRWASTRAFVIENANEGYVRINLRGREPEGVVAPGGEYDAMCNELLDVAGSMTNPHNGRRAAAHVHRTTELYSGPCTGNFPDVIIDWDPGAKVTTALSTAKYGTVAGDHAGCEVAPYYTGNHRANAFVVAKGPSVQAGGVLEGASILDLAPTMLAHFGVAVPPHMDGKVLESLK